MLSARGIILTHGFALGLMLGSFSCTQIPPPGAQSQGSSAHDANLRGTSLQLDESRTESLKLMLLGEDAETIYRLMWIAPESGEGEGQKKVGRDFLCQSREASFSCEFRIDFPVGAVTAIREESRILKASPEIPQRETQNAYLLISPPEKAGKVRLQVLDRFGERIFSSLLVRTTSDARGTRKSGERVHCVQTTQANAANQTACYFNLDTRLGLIEPVDPE